MSTAPKATVQHSFYPRATRVLAAIVWVFCALFIFNLLTTGTGSAIWHFLPGLLLIAWAVYLLMWRPSLLVRADGVQIKNILRDHTIPFGALKGVSVRQTVALETTAGRIPSWGAPGLGKLGPRVGSGGAGSLRRTASHPSTVSGRGGFMLPPVQAEIEKSWEAWEQGHPGNSSEAKVSSRWNVIDVVVLGLLILLTGAGFFF